MHLSARAVEAFHALFLRDPRALSRLNDGRHDAEHCRAVLEVAFVRDVPDILGDRCVERIGDDLIDLRRRPDERRALNPIGVGVLPRGEAALGER